MGGLRGLTRSAWHERQAVRLPLRRPSPRTWQNHLGGPGAGGRHGFSAAGGCQGGDGEMRGA
eukprot:3563201-Alexandrium_andersonii.AAC.1